MGYGTLRRTISEFRGYGVAFRPAPQVGEIIQVCPDIRARMPRAEWSGNPEDTGWVSFGAYSNDYYEREVARPRARIVSVGPRISTGAGRAGWSVLVELLDQPLMLKADGTVVPQPPELLA